MSTIIRNGQLVCEDGVLTGDLLIEGDVIAAVGGRIQVGPDEREIDAAGKYVLPGVVDAHTHFAIPIGPHMTADDFTSGTKAAACGGVTTAIDYAIHFRGDSLVETVEKRRAEADGKVHIDYGLHTIVADVEHGQLQELPRLIEMGVPSVKVFTTGQDVFFVDDFAVMRILERARDIGLLVTAHAENDAIIEGVSQELVRAGCTSPAYHGRSRPAIAEIEAVSRLICLAEAVDSAIYFVHLSTPEAVELCAKALRRGQPVIAESCPQYLILDESMYESDHPEEFVFSPPLRSVEHLNRMHGHLKAGDIEVLGSDHCAFLRAQKRQANSFSDAPPGIPGVETSLPVLYSRFVATEELSMHRLMKMLSTNPAIVYGLYPKKGALKVGSDADVVIYDPSGDHVLCDEELHGPPGSYTPFAGETIHGKVLTTISRGRVIYHDGEFMGEATFGRFVPGGPFDPGVVARL